MRWISEGKLTIAADVIGLALAGCEAQPTLFPNPDPELRLSCKQLAADASQRFPYRANLPHASEPRARAQVAYELKRIEIVNFSDQDWENVEVWVNRKYVCF